MTELKIETPFKRCNECVYLEIENMQMYANNYYYCKYNDICRNAVEMHKREEQDKCENT